MTRSSKIQVLAVLALLLLGLSGAAMAAAKVEFGRDGQPFVSPLDNNLQAPINSNCYISHGAVTTPPVKRRSARWTPSAAMSPGTASARARR